MRAIVYRRYGSPDVLETTEADAPVPGDEEVLVRVAAVGINPFDLHFLYGDPYVARPMMGLGLRRPKRPTILGSDVAGVVEAVGRNVSAFKAGDEVYGTAGTGGLAELVSVGVKAVARKPSNLTFEQAAAVPMAGYTALQALRDFGRLERGQTVLVNGASGGVGSFAVQLAKALGAARVAGVCSTRNVELVRSLGADDVVDYTRDDFSRLGTRYDVVVDTVGNRSLRAFLAAVAPKGTFVMVGGGGGRLLGPIGQLARAKFQAPFVKQRVVLASARRSAEDLAFIGGLIEAGTVRPVVDRVFPISEAAAALRYLASRHASGKVVVAVGTLEGARADPAGA